MVSRLPPATLDRYLAAVPAMSRLPTAPFSPEQGRGRREATGEGKLLVCGTRCAYDLTM